MSNPALTLSKTARLRLKAGGLTYRHQITTESSKQLLFACKITPLTPKVTYLCCVCALSLKHVEILSKNGADL